MNEQLSQCSNFHCLESVDKYLNFIDYLLLVMVLIDQVPPDDFDFFMYNMYTVYGHAL